MSTKVKVKKKRARVKIGKKKVSIKTCDTLKDEYKGLKNIDLDNPGHIDLLKCMGVENREQLGKNEETYNYLYPSLQDPNFNQKIATKKEFYDNRYEERTREQFDNIKEVAQKLCDNTEFELEPHQMFVRNFMSFQTPYNGLLLFHGLGTGKTCSSISVCEEMRTYLKQLGISKRIIIVASPAVQENFKIQLFDQRKLKEVNGLWNIKACTGNKFIKEINPMNMKGLGRNRVVRQVKRIISQSYHFQGYLEFSNYIGRILKKNFNKDDSDELTKRKQKRLLHAEFSNRMLVIDEVHNLRITEDGTVKPSSENLLSLVSSAVNLKLLLLSATPMFNDHQEIIWICNLLNLNDKRFPIRSREVFDKKGNFVQDENGREVGRELLIQKVTGYISYVRGNNPFTFPYTVYPKEARNPDSLITIMENKTWEYPEIQVNGGAIIEPVNILDLTMINIGSYQEQGYNFILESLIKLKPSKFNPEKGLAFTVLESPLQALNMIYPHVDFDAEKSEDEDFYTFLYGKVGLSRTMNYEKGKTDFRYKDVTLKNFGRIFSPDEIGKYSGKISYICDKIQNSKGIIFVYSQYIDGGAVPIALALEEMGITRLGNNSLFKTPPTSQIDALTMKPGNVRFPAKYIMITGDKSLTPDVRKEIKAVTAPNNINGEIVKVVIVSRAGSEGLDFKNIRQTHILDPWYNLNRQDQIIGRAVRNFSHCALPYEERNVEVYLYGTKLNSDIEAVDMYIYRLAERKAKKIAVIIRLLKENAVDCLLNRIGLNFSEEIIDKTVGQTLANGKKIEYRLGDKPNSQMCDFTSCDYTCNSKIQIIEDVDKTTYNENFIIMNLDKILQRIRLLFKEYYIFDRASLVAMLIQIKNYPLDQIDTALNYLITEKNEYLVDMLGRLGHLVNIGDYYMFQPIELGTKPISMRDMRTPVDYKRRAIIFKLPDTIPSYAGMYKQDNELREEGSNIFGILGNTYLELQNPNIITSIDKENWSKSAAWAIRNLKKYNGIDNNLLIKYAMHHIIDILSYSDKIQLLKAVYGKKSTDKLEKIIQDYFEQFIIEGGGYKGIIIANFSKPSTYDPYTILTFADGVWSVNPQSISGGLAAAMFDKFQYKDLKKINDTVGFMTVFKGQQIVFKTKDLKLSGKGRTNKGQRCDRGQGKSSIIARINQLLGGGVKPIKYIILKSSVNSIYGDKQTAQFVKTKNKEVKISSLQLCIESELIFRHYNSINEDGKTWFFNTVGAIINNVVKIGK
jgi:hypothetical protein